jgi:hypothetical protein
MPPSVGYRRTPGLFQDRFVASPKWFHPAARSVSSPVSWAFGLRRREMMVCLSRTGLVAHDTIVAGAQERNRRLLEQLSKDDLAVLLVQIDRLTDTPARMLAAERFELRCPPGIRAPNGCQCVGGWRRNAQLCGLSRRERADRTVKIACLAPSVALR